jgi:hypothetical protein
LAESYQRVLALPANSIGFLLLLVAAFTVDIVVAFLSGLVLIFFFPPVVERVYVNDTFTTLRLDD